MLRYLQRRRALKRTGWSRKLQFSDRQLQNFRQGYMGAKNFNFAPTFLKVGIFSYGRGVLPSVRLPVRLSARHTAVLCQNDATEDHEIFTV